MMNDPSPATNLGALDPARRAAFLSLAGDVQALATDLGAPAHAVDLAGLGLPAPLPAGLRASLASAPVVVGRAFAAIAPTPEPLDARTLATLRTDIAAAVAASGLAPADRQSAAVAVAALLAYAAAPSAEALPSAERCARELLNLSAVAPDLRRPFAAIIDAAGLP